MTGFDEDGAEFCDKAAGKHLAEGVAPNSNCTGLVIRAQFSLELKAC